MNSEIRQEPEKRAMPTRERFVASPACMPQVGLDQLLDISRDLGFQKVELFSDWTDSAVAPGISELDAKRNLLRSSPLRLTSYHLPTISTDEEVGVFDAIRAAQLAADLGAKIVIFKAATPDLYRDVAKPFLDAIAPTGLQVVIQNHQGTAISTPEDFQSVFTLVGDERLAGLLDVGQLVRVGASWSSGIDALDGRLRLIHINDIDAQGRSVPFGTGTVAFDSLFTRLVKIGYHGDVVIELELEGYTSALEPTIRELQNALEMLSTVTTV